MRSGASCGKRGLVGWIKRLEAWTDRLNARIDAIEEGSQPYVARRPTDEELESWLDSAYNPLADLLEQDNWYRWRRLQSDIEWAKKKAEEMGYDPDKIGRWLF